MEKSGIKNGLARTLVRFGVSADFLTVAGLISAVAAGVLLYRGEFFFAGVLLLLSGLFDLLDGAVARVSGSQSPFGGILDSSLDRYGDGAVLGASVLYYARTFDAPLSVLALAALLGSFGVSYVRARAECEIEDCRTGFWERGERLVLVALALLADNLGMALFFLAIGTQWTVFQRLAFANIGTKKDAPQPVPFYLKASPRNSWPYFVKVSFLILALLFVRA